MLFKRYIFYYFEDFVFILSLLQFKKFDGFDLTYIISPQIGKWKPS